VPIQTLLRIVESEQPEGGIFAPDEIAVLTTAFEKALRDLRLKDRNDPIVEMVAKLVLELVRNGERDPNKVRSQILGKYNPELIETGAAWIAHEH
jgi:hypothetical protein